MTQTETPGRTADTLSESALSERDKEKAFANKKASRLTKSGGKLTEDAYAKEFFKDPYILAIVLSCTISEFKGKSYNEIAAQICNIRLDEDVTQGLLQSSDIHFSDTEDNSVTDGLSRYDIVFDVYGDISASVTLTIDLEIQKSLKASEHIIKRGVYYLSRLISRQLGEVSGAEKYGTLHKVYSIWICPNKYTAQSGLSVFRFENVFSIPENFVLPNQDYDDADLLQLTLVSAGSKGENANDLFRFLNAVFYNHKNKQHYSEVLGDFFATDDDKERHFKEVDKMSDFTANIWEEGFESGELKGREEGLALGKAEGIAVGKAEGIAVGKAEGIAVGKAEGIAVGKAEGKIEQAINTVLSLLDLSLPTEIINKAASGIFTDAQIDKIGKLHKTHNASVEEIYEELTKTDGVTAAF